jgi:glycosyltransferase involved in cell wall biosynthesis
MPLVSIVVPTRDRAPLLRLTLATLLAQTERDCEIIVADNASSDATPELVEDLRDTRVRLARVESPIPQMANWNRALAEGRGRYLALYHDDDLYDPTIVARCRRVLDAHPNVGLVHTAARRIASDGADLGPWRSARRDYVRSGRGEALRWLAGIHDVAPPSTMVRGDLHERLGGYQADLLCADFEYYLRAALAADVAFIADELVRVRMHDDSTTSTMVPARWIAEVDSLGPRLVRHCEEAGLRPAQGFAPLLRGLRRRFARRLCIAGLTAAARDRADLARAYGDAALAIDSGPITRLQAALLHSLTRGPGPRLLRWARSARHRLRSAGRLDTA